MKKSVITLTILCLFQLSSFSQEFTGGTWGSNSFNQIPDMGDITDTWSLGTYNLINPDPSITFCKLISETINDTIQSHIFGIVDGTTMPTSAEGFDITGKNGATETIVLNFSGITDLDYIAYCGGELLSYTYDGSNVGISFTATQAALSASNINESITLFGLVMICGAKTGYEACVFRTDMYWGDISIQKTGEGYGNTTILPGANFNGTNEQAVSFDYYMKQGVLENLSLNPVRSLDKCEFTFKKASGIEIKPEKQVYYYTSDGEKTDWGGDVNPLQSQLDFDGNGPDNYIRVHASNDQWSDANVCVCGKDIHTLTSQTKFPDINITQNRGSIKISSNKSLWAKATIYDLSGSVVKSENINTASSTIDINKTGVYIIKISDNDKIYFNKFVLK